MGDVDLDRLVGVCLLGVSSVKFSFSRSFSVVWRPVMGSSPRFRDPRVDVSVCYLVSSAGVHIGLHSGWRFLLCPSYAHWEP